MDILAVSVTPFLFEFQSRLTVDTSASFEDRRFSELMKPIKDLTKNWNLPLAEYLTTYYQEIVNANQADIEIQLDGRTTSVSTLLS